MESEKNELEKRMYSLVMYQLNGRQAGIQSGHSNIEYSIKYGQDEDYKDWASKWKTVILLNGGTSNSGKETYYGYPTSKGSMENHLKSLEDMGIKVAPFYEPDLNYCLTSMSFLVDERVFNKKKYPDFDFSDYNLFPIERFNDISILLSDDYFEQSFLNAKEDFEEWCLSIGGMKNFILRLFLKEFKMANN